MQLPLLFTVAVQWTVPSTLQATVTAATVRLHVVQGGGVEVAGVLVGVLVAVLVGVQVAVRVLVGVLVEVLVEVLVGV